MISRPGWVFFIVFFFLFLPIFGKLVDGEIAAPGEALLISLTPTGLANLGKAFIWNYHWLNPFPYYYFRDVLWVFQGVTAFYIGKEMLDYIRGRG